MKLNNIVFPAPEPGYDIKHPNLFWIPKHTVSTVSSFSVKEERTDLLTYIPTIFVPSPVSLKTNTLLIFFHGNAEDAGYSEPMVDYMCHSMNAHAFIAEYPSYGVYRTDAPCEEVIFADSLAIYTFATAVMKFEPEDIILIGRSLGSGPATYLASQRKVKTLALFSPYKSIRAVAIDHVPLLGWMLQERFNNLNNIKKVEVPCFILHGQKDTVIEWNHGRTLHENCKSALKELRTPPEMTHNTFHLNHDFLDPLKEFLAKVDAQKNFQKKVTGERFDRSPPLLFMLDKFRERPL
jgi:pimeloyl-ACP methyl ester carboxylesterase